MTWVERWCETSTLTPVMRRTHRGILAIAGRWLAAEQPAITSPADWTRETCAAWVALVMRAGIGDYAQRRVGLAGVVRFRLDEAGEQCFAAPHRSAAAGLYPTEPSSARGGGASPDKTGSGSSYRF